MLIKYFKDDKVIDLNCGEAHTIVETSSSKFYAWGQGKAGHPLLLNNLS
jgi:alpha-tubulin suppressor-like RCC1 family protein